MIRGSFFMSPDGTIAAWVMIAMWFSYQTAARNLADSEPKSNIPVQSFHLMGIPTLFLVLQKLLGYLFWKHLGPNFGKCPVSCKLQGSCKLIFGCHGGFDVCGVVVSWDQWPATRKWRAQALNNQISKLTRVRVVFMTPLINTLRLVEQELMCGEENII